MMRKEILDQCIKKVAGLKELCDRCLKTERYGGNVVLIDRRRFLVSMGLRYFKTVVPKVLEFVDSRKIARLIDI